MVRLCEVGWWLSDGFLDSLPEVMSVYEHMP